MGQKRVILSFLLSNTALDNKKLQISVKKPLDFLEPSGCTFGSPNRIRTGVLALKGRCPGPLDDGAFGIQRYKQPKNYNARSSLCQGVYGMS